MRCATVLAAVVALSVLQGDVIGQTGDALYERPIKTVGPGPQRLAIDAALLASGAPFRVVRRGEAFLAEGGLKDLRLFSDAGRAVPYLLIQPRSSEPESVTATLLAVSPTKKTSGFEADLGAVYPVDRISMRGLPAPHLKRVRVEGSGDRERWTTLVAEGTVFDLPDEQLRQDGLRFAAGAYRYLRVTWDDTNSARLPMPAIVEARRVSSAAPPPQATLTASVERRPSEPGVSRYRVVLPGPGLPIVALVLDVGGGHVYRRVAVSESRFAGVEAGPAELGAAMLSRVTRDGVTASALRVPIAVPTEAEIDLAISEGANEPLDLRGVSFELAQLPWIYFEAPAGGLVARYGNRAETAPVYDLEAVRRSVDPGALPEAAWGDAGTTLRISRTAGAQPALVPAAGPTLDSSPFKYVRAVDGNRAGDRLVALPLDAHVLTFSRGHASRFADVRLLDGSNQQIPYLVERRDEPLAVALSLQPAADAVAKEIDRLEGSRRRSVYVLTLPHPRMPRGTLVVETSARVFDRAVRLGVQRPPDRDRREPWFDVRASERWRHADEHLPARPLSLPLESSNLTELVLVVDEGDNPALPITTVRLLLPAYRLRFYHPSEREVRLVYGRDDLREAQYDLALLAPRVMGARAEEVSASAVSGTAPAPPASVVSPRAFWTVLIAAVLALLLLIGKLLRNPAAPAGGSG
jgi:Protein of unknown function (DUF3999)